MSHLTGKSAFVAWDRGKIHRNLRGQASPKVCLSVEMDGVGGDGMECGA
jgi:hypothetical protein